MKTRNYLRLVTLMCILFNFSITVKVSAQESSESLKLSDAIALAMNKNKSVVLAKLDENIAASNFRQTEAVYLPQVGFSYTAITTNNPLNAFGFKLQQQSISQNDFNPELLNNPSATPDFTTRLDLKQPLINFDLAYKRKAAAKQIEVYQYKTIRTKEYLTFEVQKAYLQLQMAYDAVTVLEDALQTTRAVYASADNYFKQGLIQKSDLLEVQVQIATIESNLARAKSSIRNASDQLSLLMGKRGGVVYTTDKLSNKGTEWVESVKGISSLRADFITMQKAIEASDLLIKSGRKSYLPKLNAFGSFQLNDSQMLGFGSRAYLAGVQLSWDIFRGNSMKNSILTQTIERNKMVEELAKQKEESQLQLNKSNRDISDAQFEIRQHELSVEQSSEAFLILQNRYKQGLVNTTDVLRASSQLSQQKYALAQAVVKLYMIKAYIQFLTSSNNQ